MQLHFLHRVLGVVLAVVVVMQTWPVITRSGDPVSRRLAACLGAGVVCQVLLGFLSVAFRLGVPYVSAHTLPRGDAADVGRRDGGPPPGRCPGMSVEAVGAGLAAFNACLNLTSAILLVTGFRFIRRRRIRQHRRCMIGAVTASGLFLVL